MKRKSNRPILILSGIIVMVLISASLAIILFFPEMLPSSAGDQSEATTGIFAMDTYITMKAYGRNAEAEDKKLGIIRTEYSIQVDDKLRKDMSAMCNLSQGIRERTVAERDEKIILNMHREGYTSEQIAKIVERTIGEVEAIIKKREPVLA